jgi:hypothetical protein
MMQGAIAKPIAMKKMWMAANLRIVASSPSGAKEKALLLPAL